MKAQTSEGWVATWSASQLRVGADDEPPVPLSDTTLRQKAYVSIGGSVLRVQLSNEFGDGPVTLKALRLAPAGLGPEIDAASSVALSFAGADGVTIPQGGACYSDPVAFELVEQSSVATSIHFGSVPRALTGHPGSRTTSYVAAGDLTAAARLLDAARVERWYYLSRIEVRAPTSPGLVVTVGDSITDGRGSTTDSNDRWPDVLSRRLRAHAATRAVAVVNAGIGGNAVVSGGLGETTQARFRRDVLEQPGVRWVIVLAGVNDIGAALNPRVADALIAAYDSMVHDARESGAALYGSPILPFDGHGYFTPAHEQIRRTVNDWIRTSGRFDAVLDFDRVVADPDRPSRLLPAYDSGDGLHLSAAGYRALGEHVDVALFATG